ncbi:MAG TPA: hypothetical protein VEB18_03745 [Candidatus Paceibacterota bacterium]|nr:hypothetical protein [Candidatus Paceibacterota bacterium]
MDVISNVFSNLDQLEGLQLLWLTLCCLPAIASLLPFYHAVRWTLADAGLPVVYTGKGPNVPAILAVVIGIGLLLASAIAIIIVFGGNA